MSKWGVGDLFYPNLRLRAFARRERIPFITLVDVMARRAQERGVLFHGFANAAPGFGHLNAEGHRIAAEIIAVELCAALCGQTL
jgi:hypothetical protein